MLKKLLFLPILAMSVVTMDAMAINAAKVFTQDTHNDIDLTLYRETMINHCRGKSEGQNCAVPGSGSATCQPRGPNGQLLCYVSSHCQTGYLLLVESEDKKSIRDNGFGICIQDDYCTKHANMEKGTGLNKFGLYTIGLKTQAPQFATDGKCVATGESDFDTSCSCHDIHEIYKIWKEALKNPEYKTCLLYTDAKGNVHEEKFNSWYISVDGDDFDGNVFKNGRDYNIESLVEGLNRACPTGTGMANKEACDVAFIVNNKLAECSIIGSGSESNNNSGDNGGNQGGGNESTISCQNKGEIEPLEQCPNVKKSDGTGYYDAVKTCVRQCKDGSWVYHATACKSGYECQNTGSIGDNIKTCGKCVKKDNNSGNGGASGGNSTPIPQPDRMKINQAITTIDSLTRGLDVSVWKDASGNFNTARLASDSVAGVVLGTAGGLITSKLVKKNQLKTGFEDIVCTVGGQEVGSFGDEITVGVK